MKKILAGFLVIVLLIMCGCATAETAEEPTPTPTINLKDIPVIELAAPSAQWAPAKSIDEIVDGACIIVTGTVEKVQDAVDVGAIVTPVSFRVEKTILGNVEEGEIIEYYINGGKVLATDENGDPVIIYQHFMNEVKLPYETGHYIQFLSDKGNYGYDYTDKDPIHGRILEYEGKLITNYMNSSFYKDMNFEEAVAMLEELVEKYHKQ